MKLSELLSLKEKIPSLLKYRATVIQWQKSLLDFSNQAKDINNSLLLKAKEIQNSTADLEKLQKDLFVDLDKLIIIKQKELKETADSHNLSRDWDAKIHHDHRKLFLTDEILYQTVSGVIGKNANWQFPVVYYEPNTADLTRLIIHAEPFYVISDMEYELDSIKNSVAENFKTKILHYTKSKASQHLRPSSAGLCVAWKTFLFKTITNIEQDIKALDSYILPGGLFFFDYNDATSSIGAKAVEEGLYSYTTKLEISELIHRLGYEIVTDEGLPTRSHRICLIRKAGQLPNLNLVNKLGIVIIDTEVVNSLNSIESPTEKAAKLREQRLSHDLKMLAERDKILNEIEEKRKINHKKLIDDKMNLAMNLYERHSRDLGTNHPTTIEALMNVSRLAYSLGRSKDALHTANQSLKRARRLEDARGNNLVQSIEEWIDFINTKSL